MNGILKVSQKETYETSVIDEKITKLQIKPQIFQRLHYYDKCTTHAGNPSFVEQSLHLYGHIINTLLYSWANTCYIDTIHHSTMSEHQSIE